MPGLLDGFDETIRSKYVWGSSQAAAETEEDRF